ncbi:hypothetical protein BUALT_Bualt07G0044000 [Buddleja alternifolia]|uniref:Uncharacterized protein n=1 Tax=Buddleja alternifolia TaxID=168488 RepID=A0AAV6XEV9_9LAMI|nr:hypothetical protein BUALT_Bualt07G0044000 [Buddleja alternifolia]
MATAAYASVVSLMHVLDQIQHPARRYLHLNTKQSETLHEKIHFLQEFLELHSPTKLKEIEDLVKQIADVAIEAEDVIESIAVDRVRDGSKDESDMDKVVDKESFCEDVDKVIQKINSINKELMMVKEESIVHEQKSRAYVALPVGSSKNPSSCKETTVGFDEHLVQIMDELTGYQSKLQIIPIVGMGGIGKTTLARYAFDNPYIANHFDIRAWSIISQEYSMKEILRGILNDIGVIGDLSEDLAGDLSEDLAELGELLYKTLFCRRYLIVMDDVWSTKVWDDLKFLLPDNGNGSRIMITTRLSDVAISLGSHTPYLMNLLDEDKSWDLLCEKAFGQKSYSPELEEIGKEIAKSCGGLPLAIVVIGGLLATSDMTREYWEFVAENVNSLASSGNDEHCLKILSLSYNHLPIHLKPCFLSMGVFPEDFKVRVSRLVKLWVAEGFLRPVRAKRLEEVAEEYLKDLIDRNLILIRTQGRTGKIRTCGIHDLLRDLCVRESRKEHPFRVPKVKHVDFRREYGENMCFLCCERVAQGRIHLPKVLIGSQSTSPASPLVCAACRTMYPQLTRLRLVRVMDTVYDGSSQEFLQPTKLRYLSFAWIGLELLSPSITLLWNLQTLIMDIPFEYAIVLPSEIWEMSQLRHIIVQHRALLPYPVVTQIERTYFPILDNLQTLSTIIDFRCTKDVLERIPNLKKLGIRYYNDFKVLEIDDAFKGPEWNPIEGEFLRLKVLLIYYTDLVCWRAENSHFPILESLELNGVNSLEEIPPGIGEIVTLRSIHLDNCRECIVNSAKQILDEQQCIGNEDLQVHVIESGGQTYQLFAS